MTEQVQIRSEARNTIDPAYAKAIGVVRPEWLALHTEEVLEPDLPIVDAHHHLWELPTSTYLIDDLVADVRTGHNVCASVFVECKSSYLAEGPESMRPVGETGFVLAHTTGQAGDFSPCAAIVGWADLELGEEVQEVLEGHIAAGGGRFRGVRARPLWHDDRQLHPSGEGRPGVMLDPGFQLGVRRLGAMGLSLDVFVFHTQLTEVALLARACPDTTVILNHCGTPLGVGPFAEKRQEVFDAWRADIASLSKLANVVVKLGGLGMPRLSGFGFHNADVPPSSAALAAAWTPYIETCVEAFGAPRSMFESNFPVEKASCSYPVVWNAFKRIAAACSAAEKEALFSATASRVYRL